MNRQNKTLTTIATAVLLATTLGTTGSALAASAPTVTADRSVIRTGTSTGTYAKANCYSAQNAIAARSDARIYRSC